MLDSLYAYPTNLCLAAALAFLAAVAFGFFIQRMIKAYRHAGGYASAAWFIRGVRSLVIALTAGAWGASFYWNRRWLLIIGIVILCQEMFEGAMIGSALRSAAKIENEDG